MIPAARPEPCHHAAAHSAVHQPGQRISQLRVFLFVRYPAAVQELLRLVEFLLAYQRRVQTLHNYAVGIFPPMGRDNAVCQALFLLPVLPANLAAVNRISQDILN